MTQESKKLWRDALGSDAAWDAVPKESPPPLGTHFATRPASGPSRWGVAAAVAALSASLAVNFLLYQELSATRTDYLLAKLQGNSSSMTLATLDTLRQRHLSDALKSALEDVVRYSSDPNAQLSALDLLLEAGLSQRPDALDKLLDETRYNAAFLKAAANDTTMEST